jgi:hypothetical protein
MSYILYPTFAGQTDVTPVVRSMLSTDTLATITAANYINNTNLEGNTILSTDVLLVSYNGGRGFFTPVFSSTGVITLQATDSTVLLPTINGDFAIFSNNEGGLKDNGYSPTNPAKTKVAMMNAAVTSGHMAAYTDNVGTLGDGGVIGTAAAKAASNPADPTVASVTGAYVVNDFATFADVNGSLADSGITPSNAALPKIASVNGATIVGDFPIFSDITGTIQDSGAALHTILDLAIPGGATSYLIPVTGMTAASVAVATPNIVTNDSFITQCHTSAGALTLTFNVDPGVSTINVFWTTIAI